MKLVQVDPGDGFHVLTGSDRSQAATMVLQPGTGTGGADNRHCESDQWLYVLSGHGSCVVDGAEHVLGTGSLLLIEAGETHEITSGPHAPLVTLSLYAPPVY